MTGPYDDIMDLPRPVSPGRPHMAAVDRAAQFSPFAALAGYDAAIKETARLTRERVELDECAKAMLNEKLQTIAERLERRPYVSLTYFRPDERKAGGAYVTATGFVKKIDGLTRRIVLTDGSQVPIEEILEIDL